jgi:4-hydroxy-tetrahydrodipicolinate synthase
MAPVHDRSVLRTALDGVCGILVTPFDASDAIDAGRLAPIVEDAVAAAIDTLVINGNTSEFFSLTMAEAEAMVGRAAELIAGRVPLIAGVGRSVHDAIALTRASKRAGASAVMVHQLTDPFVAPQGVLRYLRAIADAAEELPVVLYLRDDSIGTDVIEALCRVPQVVGIKWACPTPLKLAEAMARVADLDRAWVCGLAEPWAAPMYAVGARGFTSGIINVNPRHAKRIHRALERADYAESRQLVAQMAAFERLRAEDRNGANVSVVKTALRLMGRDCGAARPPATWPLSEGAIATLRELLASWHAARDAAD